jgi:MFS family permease
MLDSTAISIRSVARPRLGHRAAFWLLALTLGLLLFASSAPSPLYVVYQSSWGFSAITLTSVFAAYALALLATLITAGSLSDHVGRRPALLVALGIEMVGMLLFAEARNVEWLFAARILQGVATGVAMGAISAALLDLQPDDNPRLGALMGVAAPLSGLAAGALVSGFLVQYAPEPTRPGRRLVGPCHPAQGRGAQRAANAVRGGGPLPGRDLGARRPGALAGPVAHGRRPR